MKESKDFTELTREVARRARNQEDYLVPAAELRLELAEASRPVLRFGAERFGLSETGHDSLADRLNIPARYYDKMRAECPELLARTVNAWAGHPYNREASWLVRVLDGEVRAVLSDRYQRYDNYEFLNSALPAIREALEVKVQSAEITGRRLYVQLTFPRLELEFPVKREGRKVGEVIRAGLVLSNSEVGRGCREIRFLVYTLACTNGMIVPLGLAGMKTRHWGGKLGQGVIRRLPARAREDRNFALAARDLARQISRDHLVRVAEQLRMANERKMTGDAGAGIKLLADRFKLTRPEREEITANLFEAGDFSQYGLINAVTRAANAHPSYDRAVELEEIGGEIFNMPAPQLGLILEARAA
jgi:hypothetical protein